MRAIIYRLRQRFAQRRLRGVEFSIVSNNCWGGHVYQCLGRPYLTPFVGLFLSPTAYLNLLGDFERLMAYPISFKTISDEPWINLLRDTYTHRWPIGCLGDGVEIQFMHYLTEGEASEKGADGVAV